MVWLRFLLQGQGQYGSGGDQGTYGSSGNETGGGGGFGGSSGQDEVRPTASSAAVFQFVAGTHMQQEAVRQGCLLQSLLRNC